MRIKLLLAAFLLTTSLTFAHQHHHGNQGKACQNCQKSQNCQKHQHGKNGCGNCPGCAKSGASTEKPTDSTPAPK